ncbi:MAG: hypothetical protein BRC24_01750, partial [Parcubacteria group bacterium SW_4_46_8]
MGVGVLSSQAITEGAFVLTSFLTAFAIMILYLFHIRVIDEVRDYYHDTIHHSNRPLPRGTHSLQELELWDRVALLLFFTLLLTTNPWAFLGGIMVWGYTFMARHEFFIGPRLKNKFFLYNTLNLVQLFLLQTTIYVIFQVQWFKDPSVWLHLWLLGNLSLILELFRKVRRKEQESSGQDTYSANFGFRRTLSAISFLTLLSGGICFLLLFLYKISFLA